MKNKLVVLFTLIATLFVVNSYAGSAENGEKLSQTCLGCHGVPGLRNPSPVYKVPMIGGQHAEYIASALQAYKSKQRSHGTMQAQAASLSDQDIADIAAYFSQLSGNSRPSNMSGAEAGQQKSAVCAGCHGADGNGSSTNYPILAGQYPDYLVQALKDYRSGDRQNGIMAGFSSNLTIQDIKELSAWFGSQSGGLSAPEIKTKK